MNNQVHCSRFYSLGGFPFIMSFRDKDYSPEFVYFQAEPICLEPSVNHHTQVFPFVSCSEISMQPYM